MLFLLWLISYVKFFLNFQIFEDFPNFLLLLISNLISLHVDSHLYYHSVLKFIKICFVHVCLKRGMCILQSLGGVFSVCQFESLGNAFQVSHLLDKSLYLQNVCISYSTLSFGHFYGWKYVIRVIIWSKVEQFLILLWNINFRKIFTSVLAIMFVNVFCSLSYRIFALFSSIFNISAYATVISSLSEMYIANVFSASHSSINCNHHVTCL